MILTQEDVDAFEQVFREFESEKPVFDAYGDTVLEFLADNPHVFMSTGYQEFVGPHRAQYAAIVRSEALAEMQRPLFRDFQGDWIQIAQAYEFSNAKWQGYRVNAFANADESLGLVNYDFDIDTEERDEFGYRIRQLLERSFVELPSFDEIIDSAMRLVDNPLVDPTAFVSPAYWTPNSQDREKTFLQAATLDVIRQLQHEEIQLSDVHWQKFEEIVAETLRADGMEIHLVRENSQGGRDIIARASFGTDEVLTLAIEVKHRSVVDKPLVQTALEQNKMFPALMFVTSGRFSTGVLREAKKPENRMRLFLRDGIAIRNLINRYPLQGTG